ncbi:transposase, partial [Roseburia intestinalis]|nr:transposase [Roseburia intestinalis]
MNEKLALKKLLTYMKSVYKIPQKIKCLTDERKRKSIPLFNIVMPVLLFLML